MSNQSHLVIGASGVVGSEIVRLLKAQGHTVRTTTSKKGGEAGAVHVNLQTGEGIREAFEGIDRAFVMSPGGYADQHAVMAPLIQEAKRRGLRKVVLLSAYGADASDQAPMRRAEIELERSGLPYNVIRPNWFMQNFNTFWVQGIRVQGKILLPAKNAKVSFIDTRDIAAVAARLLTTDDQNNRSFNLTGAESLSHTEVAETLSRATGKKITYEEIAPETLKQGLLARGVPRDYADFLLLILGYLSEGYNAAVNDEVKKLIGRDPIRLSQYAADFKASFK
jgi:uncharacterized protein YbjT (DUF2867 family)